MCCFHNKTEIEIMQGLNQLEELENAPLCQQIVYQKYLQIYISFAWDSDATSFKVLFAHCTFLCQIDSKTESQKALKYVHTAKIKWKN